MPSFRRAGADVVTRAEAIRDAEMPEVVRAGVSIRYVFAAGDKDKDGDVASPPLKSQGWPLVWKAEVNKPKFKCQGLTDVTIFIDSDVWEHIEGSADVDPDASDSAESRLDAILFDALWSIVVAVDDRTPLFDDKPPVLRDADGRPVVSLRRSDFRAEGYHATVEKYGEDSASGRAVAAVARRYPKLSAGAADAPRRRPDR